MFGPRKQIKFGGVNSESGALLALPQQPRGSSHQPQLLTCTPTRPGRIEPELGRIQILNLRVGSTEIDVAGIMISMDGSRCLATSWRSSKRRWTDILAKRSARHRFLFSRLAYKKNVGDVRESPSFKLMELLDARGANVAFHDPHVVTVPMTREHARFAGMTSLPLDKDALRAFDAALIATDHDDVDYAQVVDTVPLVIDTRNACAKRGLTSARIVKA